MSMNFTVTLDQVNFFGLIFFVSSKQWINNNLIIVPIQIQSYLNSWIKSIFRYLEHKVHFYYRTRLLSIFVTWFFLFEHELFRPLLISLGLYFMKVFLKMLNILFCFMTHILFMTSRYFYIKNSLIHDLFIPLISNNYVGTYEHTFNIIITIKMHVNHDNQINDHYLPEELKAKLF